MSGASGARQPAGRPTPSLKLPRVIVPFDPTVINGAFTLIERADATNVKFQQQPMLPSVVLLSPGNVAWELTVSDDGQLAVTRLPPTRQY